MKPASHNQLMACTFFLASVAVLCCNRLYLAIKGEEVTGWALLNGAQAPLFFMLLFGIMWMIEGSERKK